MTLAPPDFSGGLQYLKSRTNHLPVDFYVLVRSLPWLNKEPKLVKGQRRTRQQTAYKSLGGEGLACQHGHSDAAVISVIGVRAASIHTGYRFC